MTLARDLTFALDPATFAREALRFKPDPWQERVLRWSGSRLMLNCSRQSGKSTTAAALAVHAAIYTPKALILLLSPSQRQSGELLRKVLDHLSALDQRPEMAEENRLSLQLANGSRIVSLPAQEGNIRGFSGANLIIEDESSRVPDSLYYAVRPMLAVSGGRLILMSTPWGKRGHFYAEWTGGEQEWERIEIPASECPRIPASFLAEERRALGEYWFHQEYGCQFVETIDQVFRSEDIDAAFVPDVTPLFAQATMPTPNYDPEVQPLFGGQS